MTPNRIILAALLATASAAFAKPSIPEDVRRFIANADACDHAAGEFDGSLSDERQREIEQSVVKYCRPAQDQLKILTGKYKKDRRISTIIRKHANDAVLGFR